MPCRQCGANLPENASFCHVCGASDPIAKTITAQDPLVGRTLNRQYRIIKKLGEGGFGAVYLAEEPRFERKVAIKTIHEKLSENPITLERFRREGMAASKIEHPAAVKIYNLGETDDGLVFMAMEFIEGDTLSSHLRQHGALQAKAALELLAPIFEALAEAHQKGIIHRDLKPQNMMLTPKRGGQTLRLLDFGISKVASAKTLTQTSTAMGTPAYMAPEQWEEGKSVGPAADLYSMGLIVYQCVTGALPFEADTAPAWMKMHCLEAPRPLRDIAPTLPRGFCDVVMKSLSKKPADRYQDATSFLAALQQAAPVATAQPSPDAPTIAQTQHKGPGESGPNTLPGVSAPKKNAILFGAGALLVVLVLAFFWMQPDPSSPTPRAPSASTSSASVALGPATEKKEKQWRWLNPRPQGNALRRFFKLNDRELFIIGSAGTILRSRDGGVRWDVSPTRLSADLRALSLTAAGRGFTVGTQGAILRTMDGGETWSPCPSPISEDVIGVWNDDDSVVILSGTKALRASIECTKWEPASLTTPADLSSSTSAFRTLFGFQDATISSTLWIGGDEGMLYSSKDEGKTWERTILPSAPDDPSGASIFEITALLVGGLSEIYLLRYDASILSSKDLGLTWTTRTPSPNGAPLGLAMGTSLMTGTSDSVWVQSSDGWRSLYSLKEPLANFYDLSGDARGVWAVGTFGRIMFSPDGFSAWEDRSSRVPRQFLRAITGDARGQLFAVGKEGLILRSVDNGETWVQEKAFDQGSGDQIETSVDDVWVEGEMAYAISNQSFLTRGDNVWEATPLGQVVHAMWRSPKKFYVGGYDGTILSSLDQGVSWATELTLGREAGTVEDIWQSDTQELWAVGTKGLLMRSAGDANWEEIPIQGQGAYDFLSIWGSRDFYVVVGALAKRDASQTYYQGPVLFLSKDQGRTWVKRNVALGPDGLRSVWGDASGLYVASMSGVLYRSRDEGKTWQEDFATENELGRIWGINDELFVVGAGGTILHKK